MKYSELLLIIVLHLTLSKGKIGIDTATLLATEDWKCMKSNHLSFAIVEAWRKDGKLNPDVIENLDNAK